MSAAYIPPYAGIYIEYGLREPRWLPQVFLSSATQLYHTASRTLLTQTFVNPSTASPISSAKYTFPLYESCAIVAFRCYVDQRLIEGIIKEKEDASATFQAAVGRNEPASLLEQHAADVFTTSIGNIPAGQTVKVEIEYIMELKHDAEVDGLRFTIPTSIAPRYGTLPGGLSSGDPRPVSATKMNISVQLTMSSSIKSVQSPSHPISLFLGGHSSDTPDDVFNPQHALATLGQTTAELGKDFILLIKCASLSSPTALLEVHPTIPNSKALMVTLVPKFNLPRSTKPEVVFIVDRSGSMAPRVAPLRSSLSIFLKSLPLDVNFNICSFGSHHSFLWEKSRPYSNQSFAEAQRHCDRMVADFGGTEILPAIKSTIERRLNDLNLEIMVLTDGEVWNTVDLFKFVENETEKGDVRLFSLGIGQDVSHALIDGLARVGRGFSQVVSNEREGMESKVTRMLRGALSAHVVNYRLEWEGKPSAEIVNAPPSPNASTFRRRISLFDSNADADSPVSFTSPDFTIPSVIQAPYKIQPLFPFSRSTAYALLSSDACLPSHVWLRGTTPEGDELDLEIAVQRVPIQGETIHQLAARKILQELKDGTSYVHGAVDKQRQPGLLAEWVKKEGVRVGLKYGVASQWTSFVAVERKEEVVEEEKMEVVEEEEEESRDQGPPSVLDDDEWENVMQAERDDSSHDDDVHIRSRGGAPPAALFGGGLSVPVPVMRQQGNSLRGRARGRVMGSALPPNSDSFVTKSDILPCQPMSSPINNPGPNESASLWSSMRMKEMKGSSASILLCRQSQYPAASPLSSPQPSGSSLANKVGVASAPLFKNQGGHSSPPVFFMPMPQYSAARPLSTPHPSGSMASAQPGSMFGASSSLGNKMSMATAPDSVVENQAEYSSTLLLQEGYKPSRSGAGVSKKRKLSNTPNIGITYSPSSAPPPERLSADTGARPLSSRTKALIDLQTFEGSFMLDSTLASLLGVPISVLEAKLPDDEPGLRTLSPECKKKAWATVLAIKLFETQLAGERSVWQLVVDKARVWMGGIVGRVSTRLEKLAGEVLGV